MPHLTKVDHITYAVATGMMEKWAWYHIEVEGGRLINRIDDVNPQDPNSSMKIWCIDYGTFGIALVEGIDRKQKSQVTRFVDKHGDHAVQHVAYDTDDLDAFLKRLQGYGCHPRGETLVRNDGFGILKQMFGKGYDDMDPAEMSFPEYVERPKGKKADEKKITFSQQAGKGFYQQIEDARASGDTEKFIDFSKMPSGWLPPAPQPSGN
jgi:hypothetical protein